MSELLIFAFVAVLFVPLFQWARLGAILAYLFSGILIGPSILGLIRDTETILHVSELGVVFLLFIIGLELAPAKLWRLRNAIFGMGLLQVALTGGLFTLIGISIGLSPALSFVGGFGLSLSSTAFAVQLLEEKRQLNTTHGQGSFSILMFQDLAVIPIMMVIAVLTPGKEIQFSVFGLAKIVGVFALLILFGVFGIRYVFRWIAKYRVHEIFISMAFLIVLGTAVLMEEIGLTMGMGAFFAGVLLANSEYRHELESDLMPFKGLLLGLFFIAVGMSLNLQVVIENPLTLLGITILFMIVKGAMVFGLGLAFKMPFESAKNMAFTIPQGGEFAFVLFSTAMANQLIDSDTASLLSASVTVSMALTPLLFSINQKYFRRSSEISERPYDTIDNETPEIIVAGFGRFGQIVTRILLTEDFPFTIL
ncbi:MAG: monovalent cation:proton antiporter-2 (CPA2) family protein, partial [Bdellovibrionales bacterium]|nr:monovalent cation:proton antiporter-2 (CPA2) family protein [Bdellovibrionales bacterium]